MWCAQIAESARLSQLQRDTILKLRNLYLRNIGILARRRQRLTALLQVLRMQAWLRYLCLLHGSNAAAEAGGCCYWQKHG